MAIDASIPLRALGSQQNDPMESYGKMMALKNMQMQQDVAQRQINDERALSEIYASAIDPNTGKVNHGAVLSGMARLGQGSKIGAYQKQVAEAQKAEAEIGKIGAETGYKQAQIRDSDFNILKEKRNLINGAMASLLSKQGDITHQDVISMFAGLAQQGVIGDEDAQRALKMLPGDPSQLRPLLMQKALEGMDAAKRLEAVLPQLKQVNDGKTTSFVDTNPITNPAGPAPIKMLTTPGEDLNAATSRANNAATVSATIRGQDLTDARTREGLQQGKIPPGYRQLPDGSLQAIPGGPADAGTKDSKTANKALDLIREARKVIDGATGSYLGAVADEAARVFGKSTRGARATAQLKALEGALMMAQPRMEGPQSNMDVALYRQMAAQIGDPTTPVKTRKAALDTIEKLHIKYATGAPVQTATPAGARPPMSAFERK